MAARADAARTTLRELDGVTPEDDVDVVTLAAMRERLGVQIELHDAGLDVGELNVIASPLQSMRDVFDLMATDTDDDWALVSRRLSRVPDRVEGYAAALRTAVAAGHPPAVRQVGRGIEQAGQIQQLFVDMVANGAPGHETLHAELQQRASEAADAYSRLAAVLRDEIGPHARGEDAFGRDAYRLFSRLYLGAMVDLDETYEWGLRRLESIVAEQESIADRLYPGSSVGDALRRLDEEPRYVVQGTDALQNWMQDLSDRVVDALADTHFEIAEPLRTPGMPDRADPDRRDLLHRPVRRFQQTGTDVVVGAARRRHLPHLAGDHHRFPRRRSRSSPADRSGGRAVPTS